jgi:hypothetical protein
MFDLDQFIADCQAAVAADPSHKLVREVVARAVADPAGVLKAVGEPKLGCVDALYRGEDVTILNVVWPPLFTIMPHEHRMWAVIGVYTGAEDNMFWRRIGEPGVSKVEAAGGLLAARRRRRAAGARHRAFGDQPDRQADRRDPRLRRRFLRRAAQRMGPRDAHRASLRCRQEHAALRRGEHPAGRRVTSRTNKFTSVALAGRDPAIHEEVETVHGPPGQARGEAKNARSLAVVRSAAARGGVARW